MVLLFLEVGYRVYFVDFGNEETVSMDRLSECPDVLRTIPWQCIQIKLAQIQLTDDERHLLLRKFEAERLEMKIVRQQQNIFFVELCHHGMSLVEYMYELRHKKIQRAMPTDEVR
jgi:hypothetical protein